MDIDLAREMIRVAFAASRELAARFDGGHFSVGYVKTDQRVQP